jgi:hypothetical protein
MQHKILVVGALTALGSSAFGAVVLTDNARNESIGQFVTAESLVDLNLAGLNANLDAALNGPGGNGVNQLVSNFSAAFGLFTGTLTSTVYANQSLPGLGVNQVAIVYEFVANGPSGIDFFNFGLNTGQALDYDDIIAATHGRLTDSTATTPGQLVQATADNTLANPNLEFDFEQFGKLGGPSTTERLTWYVIAGGDVRINVVDVGVIDAGTATAQALSFTTTPGQDDLNVPAPGAAALGLMAFGAAARRRRR